MNDMEFRRQPMQVCKEVASLYNAATRLEQCATELATDKKATAEQIRACLKNEGIVGDVADAFIGMYRDAVARSFEKSIKP
jgi:hypothetical protein